MSGLGEKRAGDLGETTVYSGACDLGWWFSLERAKTEWAAEVGVRGTSREGKDSTWGLSDLTRVAMEEYMHLAIRRRFYSRLRASQQYP